MRRVVLVLAAAAVLSSIAVPSWAGALDNSKVALHVKARTAKNICATNSPVPPDTNLVAVPCSQFVTTGALDTSYNVYLVVAQAGEGIGGLSCGVDYNPVEGVDGGVDVFSWTRCADLEFKGTGPNGVWPAPASGNRITWAVQDNCQDRVVAPDDVHAVAGAFYITAYSDDVFAVTPNTAVSPAELAVANCSSAETDITSTGRVGFGASAAEGCNPCTDPEECATPVASTTWGQLKNQYK